MKVYKATPENCPDGKVIPCAPEDGTQIICDASDPRLKEWMSTGMRARVQGEDAWAGTEA